MRPLAAFAFKTLTRPVNPKWLSAFVRIAQAIYTARTTLAQSEQSILDELLNVIYPYTFFADATHHMFWMQLRGILQREHDPIGIAGSDIFCPSWQLRELPPLPNPLQDIVNELAAIRKELELLKGTIQRKRS